MPDQHTNGNGIGGAHAVTLALEYDQTTNQVRIGGDAMAISLAQMICDEAARVLGDARRMAAIAQMQRSMQDNAITQALQNRGSIR